MATATQITTGRVRFSYVNAFTPRAAQEGAQPKYSVTLLIPKTDKNTIAKIKAAIEAAKTAYLQKHSGKKLPSTLKTTLHDGDGERPNGGEFGPECKGHYVMTCSSNNKPVKDALRERDRQDVRDGLMQKWEYRVKWYNETEEVAKSMCPVESTADPFNLG